MSQQMQQNLSETRGDPGSTADRVQLWVEDDAVPFSPSSSGVLSLQGTSRSDSSTLDSEVSAYACIVYTTT